jgi:hypothetical protein
MLAISKKHRKDGDTPLRGKGNAKEMRKQKKTRHGTRKRSKKQY